MEDSRPRRRLADPRRRPLRRRRVGAAGSTGRGEANLYNLCSFLIVEQMRRGKSPKDAGMEALRRIKTNTVEKRLLNARGLPELQHQLLHRQQEGRVRRRVDVSGQLRGVHRERPADAAVRAAVTGPRDGLDRQPRWPGSPKKGLPPLPPEMESPQLHAVEATPSWGCLKASRQANDVQWLAAQKAIAIAELPQPRAMRCTGLQHRRPIKRGGR